MNGKAATIFVGGCDRSGTTMLGSLLGRYQGIVTLPESPFIADAAEQLAPAQRSGPALGQTIAAHTRYRAWRDVGCDDPMSLVRASATLAENVIGLASRYGACSGRLRWHGFVDHCPRNIDHARALSAHFPDLRLIHIFRDGRAVAESILRMDWGPVDIVEAASFWIERVCTGFAAVHSLGPSRAISVRYEDIVGGGTAPLDAIADFAGIGGLPQTRPDGLIVPSAHREIHALVNQPMAPSRIASWRDTLPDRDVEIFEMIAGGLLKALGYDLVHDGPDFSRIRLRERLRFAAQRGIKRRREWRAFQRRYA